MDAGSVLVAILRDACATSRAHPQDDAEVVSPALILSLARNNIATREGAAAGIIAGVATVAGISLTGASFHTLMPSAPTQF